MAMFGAERDKALQALVKYVHDRYLIVLEPGSGLAAAAALAALGGLAQRRRRSMRTRLRAFPKASLRS